MLVLVGISVSTIAPHTPHSKKNPLIYIYISHRNILLSICL
jgi:hypothetical protein